MSKRPARRATSEKGAVPEKISTKELPATIPAYDQELLLGLFGVASSQLFARLLKRKERAFSWNGEFPEPSDVLWEESWDQWRAWLKERDGHEIIVAFAIHNQLLVPVHTFTVSNVHVEAESTSVWFAEAAGVAAGKVVVWTALDLGKSD